MFVQFSFRAEEEMKCKSTTERPPLPLLYSILYLKLNLKVYSYSGKNAVDLTQILFYYFMRWDENSGKKFIKNWSEPKQMFYQIDSQKTSQTIVNLKVTMVHSKKTRLLDLLYILQVRSQLGENRKFSSLILSKM